MSDTTQFFKTTVAFHVLSERPIDDLDLSTIVEECETGDMVMNGPEMTGQQLSPQDMAQELLTAGSDPGFFMLDDDGNEAE